MIAGLLVLAAAAIVAVVVFTGGGDTKNADKTPTTLPVTIPTTNPTPSPTSTTTSTTANPPTSATASTSIPTPTLGPTLDPAKYQQAISVSRRFLAQAKAGNCPAAYKLADAIFKKYFSKDITCGTYVRQALTDWNPATSVEIHESFTDSVELSFRDGTKVNVGHAGQTWLVSSFVPSY